MKKCHEIEDLIKKMVSGDMDPGDLEKLKQHTSICSDCADLLKAHQMLTSSSFPLEKPDDSDFSMMRSSVSERIRNKRKDSAIDKLLENLNSIWAFLLRPEMAVAALTLIVGFFLGRFMPSNDESFTEGIIKQISVIANENKHLEDIQNSSYRYSNVSLKEIDSNNISLSFEVSRHVDLVGKKDDPVVKEVLAQTLLNPSAVGTRLKAISYSETILDQKLKEALIFSMHNAPIMAVRLKAMSSLVKYKNDLEVEEAFLKTLREEESVQMRLLAIDYFEKTNFNPDTLRTVLYDLDPAKNRSIMIKANKYIKKQKQQ